MERIEQLLIESAEPYKSGSKNGREWTLYNVKAGGKNYRTFLDLHAGQTAFFVVKEEQSDRTDKQGRPYINREIIKFSGPISQYPAPGNSYSVSTPPGGASTTVSSAAIRNSTPTTTPPRGEQYATKADIETLAKTIENIISRIEFLEIGLNLPKDPDDQETPF